MKILQDPHQFMMAMRQAAREGRTIGLVPTMGALHNGHVSLLERARTENDIACASIFINPTQFDNPDDLSGYPKTWESDVRILEELGIDFLFAPNRDAMYPDQYAYRVIEKEFSHKLCGKHRKGHFDGVLTVVMKLLNITGADRAYFGEKDWQQLLLVRRMTEAFFISTEIIPCPTVREKSGLAMSSRNSRLTPQEADKAPLLYKTLISGLGPGDIRKKLESYGFMVEYIETYKDPVFGSRLLAAANLGNVRLIDNVEYKGR